MLNKYFDEIEVGEGWLSRGRTVTESDIVSFASISGDWYPLHTDKEYAAKTVYKERIAHGMLILSISSGLWDLKPGIITAFYGIDKLRFTNPVFIGDTIHVKSEVLSKKSKGDNQGLITLKNGVFNQHNEIVLYSELKIMVVRKK